MSLSSGSLQAGSLLTEAVKTFDALPFAGMMLTLQSSELEKHALVRPDDLLTTQADWCPLFLVNQALAFAARKSVDGLVGVVETRLSDARLHADIYLIILQIHIFQRMRQQFADAYARGGILKTVLLGQISHPQASTHGSLPRVGCFQPRQDL